jgi:hypothetical protein
MSNPLSSYGYSDADYSAAVGIAMAEAGHKSTGQTLRDEMAGVIDVAANRLSAQATRPGSFRVETPTLEGVITAPSQFDPTSRRGSLGGRTNYAQGRRAALDDRYAGLLDVRQQERLAAAKEMVMSTLGTRQTRGISHNATFFSGPKISKSQVATHNALGRRSGTRIGNTTFYGKEHDRNRTVEAAKVISDRVDRTATARSNPRTDSPIETNRAGMEAARNARSLADLDAFRDETDVLANEQLGVPDLPGPLSGMPAPDFSLADIGGIPDRSTGSFYDSAPDYSDISRGILHDTDQARGFTGSLNAPDYDPNVGLQPDFSDISRSVFGDQTPRNGIGLGVTGYDPNAIGTSAFPDIGPYDALAPAREAFPDQPNPNLNNVTSPEPLGAPQGFANYGNRDVGYPSSGFNSQPNRPGSLADLGMTPISHDPLAGIGYNPAVVAAAAPIGNPRMGLDTPAQMTRGITGYTTTTRDVPNPAWSEWSKDYATKNALQEAYLADQVDRHGPAKPTNVPDYNLAPEPPKTVPQVEKTPVYGPVAAPPVATPKTAYTSLPAAPPVTDPVYGSPVGGSWGGPDSWGGFGSGYDALANSPKGGGGVLGTNITDAFNAGIADMNANPGAYGYSGGGPSLGALGGLGFGNGYGGINAATSFNEQQGGAGYGFSGSQGSDPSGRGGLY